MEKIRERLRSGLGVVAELLGYVLIVYVIGIGILSLHTQFGWGSEFRTALQDASNGVDVSYAPRPTKSSKR